VIEKGAIKKNLVHKEYVTPIPGVYNLEKILDYILQEYTYIGFTKLDTHTEIYIEYKGKNYTYYDLTLDNATILDYNRLIETLLKWKCGVCYDRTYK
ncbi:MAG: hypothetical protein HXL14_04495, partial [Parvimonas sp.]|nr:hypothetical protein [Parvimonas sp.]